MFGFGEKITLATYIKKNYLSVFSELLTKQQQMYKVFLPISADVTKQKKTLTDEQATRIERFIVNIELPTIKTLIDKKRLLLIFIKEPKHQNAEIVEFLQKLEKLELEKIQNNCEERLKYLHEKKYENFLFMIQRDFAPVTSKGSRLLIPRVCIYLANIVSFLLNTGLLHASQPTYIANSEQFSVHEQKNLVMLFGVMQQFMDHRVIEKIKDIANKALRNIAKLKYTTYTTEEQIYSLVGAIKITLLQEGFTYRETFKFGDNILNNGLDCDTTALLYLYICNKVGVTAYIKEGFRNSSDTTNGHAWIKIRGWEFETTMGENTPTFHEMTSDNARIMGEYMRTNNLSQMFSYKLRTIPFELAFFHYMHSIEFENICYTNGLLLKNTDGFMQYDLNNNNLPIILKILEEAFQLGQYLGNYELNSIYALSNIRNISNLSPEIINPLYEFLTKNNSEVNNTNIRYSTFFRRINEIVNAELAQNKRILDLVSQMNTVTTTTELNTIYQNIKDAISSYQMYLGYVIKMLGENVAQIIYDKYIQRFNKINHNGEKPILIIQDRNSAKSCAINGKNGSCSIEHTEEQLLENTMNIILMIENMNTCDSLVDLNNWWTQIRRTLNFFSHRGYDWKHLKDYFNVTNEESLFRIYRENLNRINHGMPGKRNRFQAEITFEKLKYLVDSLLIVQTKKEILDILTTLKVNESKLKVNESKQLVDYIRKKFESDIRIFEFFLRDALKYLTLNIDVINTIDNLKNGKKIDNTENINIKYILSFLAQLKYYPDKLDDFEIFIGKLLENKTNMTLSDIYDSLFFDEIHIDSKPINHKSQQIDRMTINNRNQTNNNTNENEIDANLKNQWWKTMVEVTNIIEARELHERRKNIIKQMNKKTREYLEKTFGDLNNFADKSLYEFLSKSISKF